MSPDTPAAVIWQTSDPLCPGDGRQTHLTGWIEEVVAGRYVGITITCEEASVPVKLTLHLSDAEDLRKQLKRAIRAIEYRAARPTPQF